MDLQKFVDCLDTMTCVMSVEMKEDGKRGDIRIVTGNKAYIDSIESAWDGPQLMMNKFIPNSLYQNYFPKDLNFEEICYRAAVLKKPVHTYVHPDRFDFWFNLFLLPLHNEGNIYYCTYTQEVTQQADTEQMAKKVNHEVTDAVLNTCIKLHGSTDFKQTINDVIVEIRKICNASSCTILTVDQKEKTCEVLADDRAENSGLESMANILNMDRDFYNIVETWPDTLSGSNCLIIKDENDMDYIKEKNPVWYNSLTGADVTSIVFFPLKNSGKLLGYMWATNFETSNAANIKEALELTTYFVASSLATHQLLKDMKTLSSVDMLTGVLNRNEMNNRIDSILRYEDPFENLGIVFADINGLKRTNDENGHGAGDQLLKNAAHVLADIFRDGEVFRAGGDEYMILMPNTTESFLADAVERARAAGLGFKNACFAAGYSFLPNSKDILKGLHEADERMYVDKEAFYEAHPDLVR